MCLLLFILRRPSRSTLFPYTTLFRSARAIERFTIEELSNWYIRRNRRRFWKSESDRDKAAAYHTLYESLDRNSTRLNSSHSQISYAVFCLKKITFLFHFDNSPSTEEQ